MTNCLQDISSYVMFVSFLVLGILTSPVVTYTKPHIVMVVADDLGWDDVSFHGSNQIPTPTLDRFAREGVILNNYYVSPLSTPSRAAFMTGKYASHLGLQHDDFHNQQPAGLPLTETILPNRLRELGYSARGVGKWHLGFFAKEYTPTYRGFDSFFGFWTDTEDYFSHVSYDNGYGLDLRRDLQLVYNESGSYSTELFTKEAKGIIERYDGVKPLFLYVAHQAVHVGNGDDPLQVPEKYVKQFAGIKDVSRRKFAGMITTIDESLKIISEALTKKDMMKNTIIVFTTDNGAAAGGYENSAGSNYPLRGSKNTFWEGGVRGVGFVYSPLLQTKGRTCDELIHATDWLPTLYAAGGGNILSLGKIDGYNVWDTLSTGSPSPRFEVLHGVDTMLGASGALRVGDYKLIVNLDDTYYGDWYPRPGTPVPIGTNKRKRRQLLEGTTVDCTIREPHPLLFTHAPVCKPREKPCLFNIKWDPCEYHNIGEIMPNTMKVMLERFYHFANSSASPIYPESDNSSRPDLHDGSWTFWRDNPQMPLTNPHFVYPDPMRDLKLNDHGGSSAPYNPPDNEKIFKEKAKHAAKPLTNVTMNTTIMGKHETYNVSTPHKVFLHHDKTKLPASLTHPLSTTHHDHPPHSPHQVEPPELTNKAPPTIQKVWPNMIIEGIGNLIDTKHPPKLLTPTEGPFLPDTTKAPSIQFLPTTNTPFSSNVMTTTERPSIDIQNMLMDEIGSGLYPTIAPTKEFMLPTKPPNRVKNMKPLSLGEVISGRPASSKTSGDKSIGAKLQTNEMKIDLPQVYDVIDETDNLPENQGLTGNVPNIYDVVDLNQQGTKATSKQQPHHKGHNKPGSEMWTIAEKAPESKPKSPPPPPPPPPQSPLSSFFKPTGKPEPHIIKAKPVVETPERIPPAVHNFEGDIIMDGHKFHVKGTETGDNEWLMQDAPSHQSPRILKPATPKPKSKVPIKKPAGKDGSEDAPDYSEVIDVIDESPKEERKADEYKKVQQALEKTVDHVSEKKVPKPVSKRVKAVNKLVEKENGKNVSVPHVHGNGTGITKKNDTNCEKPVQLESSDNAVVVSSVVIVVIASAMVVGVALVAMIAVVARHFQRTKNQDGGGAS